MVVWFDHLPFSVFWSFLDLSTTLCSSPLLQLSYKLDLRFQAGTRRRMDAAKKKALFRAKLNAQKKEKRIDSPLVRYNDSDQPVCRVCNVLVKSEALWDAHLASRKHHESIEKFKANAIGHKHDANTKSRELVRTKHEDKVDVLPSRPQASSLLPPDFFDSQVTKRQKTGLEDNRLAEGSCDRSTTDFDSNELSSRNGLPPRPRQPGETRQPVPETLLSGVKQGKGALPEGFFDNKNADLRARGIKPVKPDVKEEYKEFEKSIQEDLKEVDDRLEEEEIDAAEMIEEEEIIEQKSYREKVELLRKKKLELMVARSVNRHHDAGVSDKDSSVQESHSEDDDEDDSDNDGISAVDWRAQHL